MATAASPTSSAAATATRTSATCGATTSRTTPGRSSRPRGKRPQPRFGHSAVWVDGFGVVVFAGQRGADFFDDLWAFDPDADRGPELPAKGAVPKRRYGSCMVVGPDGRLWISHGFTFAGRFDDTRAYNLKTRRWASIAPDGRRPGERCLHDCFTSAAGELVLYGGQDDGAFALGDLWVMGRERTWQRQPDPGPKPRRLYAVTEAGAYAYVFGGAGEDNRAFDDLWRVDRETLEFERVKVDGPAPARTLRGHAHHRSRARAGCCSSAARATTPRRTSGSWSTAPPAVEARAAPEPEPAGSRGSPRADQGRGTPQRRPSSSRGARVAASAGARERA